MRKHIIMEEYNLGRSALKKIKPKSWKKRKRALLSKCRLAENASDHVRLKRVFTRSSDGEEFYICLFCGQWFWDRWGMEELESEQIKRMIKR